MSKLTLWLDRIAYPNSADNWDNELFRRILKERIGPESICLDYGAGRGRVKQLNFRGVAKFIAGVDPDPIVFENTQIDEARLLDLSTSIIPYPDNTFSVVYSANVIEHVDNPEAIFREIRRVLKPGGLFLSKSINKRHYVAIIARLTPTIFHRYYNKLRGRKVHDTFPTYYRCNSRPSLLEYAKRAGFAVERVQFFEGRPEYLRLTAFFYFLGILYERIVNAADILEVIRCVMIFELRKPDPSHYGTP